MKILSIITLEMFQKPSTPTSAEPTSEDQIDSVSFSQLILHFEYFLFVAFRMIERLFPPILP